jgi:hypothetical protein
MREYSRDKIHSFSVGMPIPYMFVYKGLKETIKWMLIRHDELYIYAGYQYHQIPNVDTNGFWMFNFMSQIVLPKR